MTYGENRDTVRTHTTVAMYRLALKDPRIKKTFCWQLESCGFLKTIENEEQRILHNWMIRLLENAGFTQGGNLERIVDFLLTLEIPPEAIEKGRGDGPGTK